MADDITQLVTLGGVRLKLKLSETAKRLAASKRRPRTLKVYARALQRFDGWCKASARSPWEPVTVAEYIADRRAVQGLGLSAIGQDMTAIRLAYRVSGRTMPTADGDVAEVVGGARREAAAANPPDEAPALRADDWRAACRALAARTRDGADPRSPERRRRARHLRDRAILVVGYLAAMRKEEIVYLDLDDVTVEAERGLVVRLRATKTSDAPLWAVLPSGTDEATDPVRTWRAYLDARPSALDLEGTPAFTRTGRGGASDRLCPERIGANHTIERIIRGALAMAKVPDPEQYTSHSLRAGIATELAELGVPLTGIQRTGRWKRLDTVMRYAHRGTRFADSALHRLRY